MPRGADRLSAADRGAPGSEWGVDLDGGRGVLQHRRMTLSLVAASCGFA